MLCLHGCCIVIALPSAAGLDCDQLSVGGAGINSRRGLNTSVKVLVYSICLITDNRCNRVKEGR